MNKIPAYMKPISETAYRKPALPLPRITGFYNLIPSPDVPPRFVYEVTYQDGEVDCIPLSGVEGGHWKIVVSDKE